MKRILPYLALIALLSGLSTRARYLYAAGAKQPSPLAYQVVGENAEQPPNLIASNPVVVALFCTNFEHYLSNLY
jgi:hypothetical protein